MLVGPIGAALLVVTMVVASAYPLNKRRFERVRQLLARRQERAARRRIAKTTQL